jgi:TolB-like protein
VNAPPAHKLLVILVLCLFPGLVFAQAEPPAAMPTCVIFPIQDMSAGGDTKEYEQTITDSLSAWFKVAGFSLVTASGNAPAPLSESQTLSAAAALDAGFAVTGSYLIQGDQIYVAVQVWDVSGGRLITGVQQRAHFNLAFYSALHDWIADMLLRIEPTEGGLTAVAGQPVSPSQSLEPQLQTVPQASQPAQLSAITFLSHDEGMELSLPGNVKIGSVANGKLTWSPAGLPQGATLRVLKEKPGYHTEWQTVRAAAEIHLSSLAKMYSNGVEADWTFGQLAGLGGTYRRYVSADNLFLFGGGYFFTQPPLSSTGLLVYHADASLGFGGYVFFPPSAYVRLGLSTGVGADVTFTAVGTYNDFYWNLLNWWLETRAIGPIFFLRQEWKFATGIGNNLLGTGWMNIQHIPPFTFGVRFEW